MPRQWTDGQRLAITLREKNILVSAAAGSGKTAVLVERIVSRILDENDPVGIDEFLVMTFTKAAAAEMKERILLRLKEELEHAPGKTARYEYLKKQAALIDCARISTIDSFCMSILREHMDKTGLDPSFRVASEEDLLLLKEDVLDDLLEEEFESAREDFIAFADSFSGPKSDRKIAEYILLIYKEAMGQPRPLEWLQKNASLLLEKKSSWLSYILEEVREFAAETAEEIDAAIRLCREPDGPLGYLSSLSEDKTRMEALSEAEDFFVMGELLASMNFPVIGRVKKDTDEQKKNAVKAIRDRYKEYFKYLAEEFSFSPERLLLEQEQENACVSVLLRLAGEFIRRFSEKKKEKNLADFYDLEHIALSILRDGEGKRTKAAMEYTDAFREIYIDEYQDSNGIQEELIQAIEKGNVFMVGDIKQSIYGFRNARPALFLEKYHSYLPPDKEGRSEEKDRRIDLSMNFRSRESVLQGVNGVFAQLMRESVGGIAYDDRAALYPGASFLEEDKREGRTAGKSELLLYEEIRGEEDRDRRYWEAKMVAQRIRQLVKGPKPLLVQDNNRLRPISYRDIVILLRTGSGWSEQFAEVLGKAGIPSFADTSRGYFDSMEVLHFLSFLSAIDNPYIDIPVAGFLKSTLVGFSDRELASLTAWYRENHGEDKTEKLYNMLRAAGEAGEKGPGIPVASPDGDILGKAKKALGLLEKYRRDALFLDISRLIRKIYEETDYLNDASAMPSGHIRRANLLMLIEKAKTYEETGYRGLFHFIRYIEKLKSYDGDFGEAQTYGENEDMVRIMTIHKSKGLEFPVCFLCGLGKGFNLTDTRDAILSDGDFGIACDCVDRKKRTRRSSLKKNIIKYKKKKEMIAEELRILYVAMTRARELLILTGSRQVKEEEKGRISSGDGLSFISPLLLQQGKTYLDWLLPAFYNRFDLFATTLKYREDFVKEEMESMEVNREAVRDLGRIRPEKDKALWERFYFTYPFERDIRLHTKLSVSALKGDYVPQGEKKLWEAEETVKGPGGINRGRVYHRLLEKLDFSRVTDRKSFATFLDACEEKGIIHGRERKLVRSGDFLTLLSSDLGRRLKASFEKNRLWREQEFILNLPANAIDGEASEEMVLVQGVIDAYLEEEDGILLIDYKTDRLKEEQEFTLRYEKQLHYYGMAIEGFTDKPVKEKIIWSFALGRAVPC